MRFTDAYAPAPICSASRASILTGKTTARLGLEFVVKADSGEQVIEPAQPLKAPPFKLSLELEETTIAELLLGAGYNTAYFGKWHLNPHYKGVYLGWSPVEGPGQQGFSVAGEDFGSHPYNKREMALIDEPGRYYPDGMTDRAIRFIEQDHEAPFFLMVSHFYVHTPVRSPYTWLLDKYEKTVPAGIPNRTKRVKYAAFLETLDHHVGQLLDALGEADLAESTLVIFLSDNGGHPEYVSNKPLRGSKWNLYEGGIRVPMIVRWPESVKKGSVCDQPVAGYDVFPTLAEVSEEACQHLPEGLDGKSLLPLLTGNGNGETRSLYWHFPYYHPEGRKFGLSKAKIGVDDFEVSQTRPHSAIRHGDHKLVYFGEDKRCELYDLVRDISEQNDLSGNNPSLADSLKNNLLRYLDSVDARMAVANQQVGPATQP
jgi:uncharacterized sulfatase